MNREVLSTAIALMIAGCTSAPTHYYRLHPPDYPGAQLSAQDAAITLDSVTIPELVDRMQLVVEASTTQIRLLQHERWAVPLRDQIVAVLNSDLRAILTVNGIGCTPQSDCGRPLHLNVEIDRFDATPKGFAIIEARWQLRGDDVRSSAVWSATERQPLTDDSPDTIVLAWSAALRGLSTQIAESVRKRMAETP